MFKLYSGFQYLIQIGNTFCLNLTVYFNLGRRKSLDADFLFTGEKVIKNSGPFAQWGMLVYYWSESSLSLRTIPRFLAVMLFLLTSQYLQFQTAV